MDPQRKIQPLSSSKSDRKKVRDRKKNIFKKAEELSKLCGIDVCLLLYQRESTIAETWPQDSERVNRILTGYKASRAIRGDTSNPSSLSSGKMKARKSDGSCENAVDSEREISYPTWDDRLDCYSEEELIELVASLDAKLEASTKRIDSLSMKSSKTGGLDHHHIVNTNMNSAPFRELNDLNDPR